jgi:S-adenosylmethionine:tRNA ribosyltransferase-isomerase
MLTADFDYHLPDEYIAQEPALPRDSCRLLVLHRKDGRIEHRVFRDILDYLQPHDLLVANDTRVLPARLLGNKVDTGATAELLLLRELESDIGANRAIWEALVKPGRRLKPGAQLQFLESTDARASTVTTAALALPILYADILDWLPDGTQGGRLVRLSAAAGLTVRQALHQVGIVPLPPYITHYQGDRELYQTVFANNESSAAAPTAGLHFTRGLLEQVARQGTGFATVELEVGLDTFRPVDEQNIEDHQIHTERYSVSQQTVDAVNLTRTLDGRVIAVGTTSVRSLESAYNGLRGQLEARKNASTALYITPGYRFQVVDALLTNFHVPRSTLLMLVSALADRKQILTAYEEALRERYRFLSFGDAMLIL